MKNNKNRKRGQISMDFILAIMFLMFVSLIIYYNVLTFTNNTTNALIVDRMYSIADTFEDYAILSYSKNETVILMLRPVGDITYVIQVSNKIIPVSSKTFVIFTPTDSGVTISGDNVVEVTENVGKNITIRTVIDKEPVIVSKKLRVNII